MDIRDRKSELEAAQQTVKFFETLLHASADGIVITDPTQTITVVNKAFCAFWGQRQRAVAETSLFLWLEQLDSGALQRWANLEQRVRLEGSCCDVEFHMMTKDGERHFSVNASLLDRIAGEETGVIISIWRDITEHKRAYEELRRYREQLEELVTERTSELKKANRNLQREIIQRKQVDEQLNILVDDIERVDRELQDFAYIASHDLKAPLRGISSLAKWLQKDYAGLLDEKGRRYLNQMLARTKRMHHFIEGILQYSRLGRANIKQEALDADAFVRQVITAISPPETIMMGIAGTLPTVVYDKTLLSQLFQNLLDNAMKHLGKPEGQVMVSCSDRGKHWEFAVKDTGVGIEARHFERIFKMFQSLKPRQEAESTGIGLALVKKIVERHGGTIRVESTVGEGSAFVFTIPKTQETAGIESHHTVLILDANPEFAMVLVKMLERAGHAALYAPDRQHADDICEAYEGDIRIALIDTYIAGEEDMPEWYAALRNRYPAIKIMLMRGKDFSDTGLSLNRETVDGVLTKPFNLEEFSRMVNS